MSDGATAPDRSLPHDPVARHTLSAASALLPVDKTMPRTPRDPPKPVASLDSQALQRDLDRRVRLFGLLAVLAFSLLGARLWYLQVTNGPKYRRMAENNFVREIELLPVRGEIYDVRGRRVAENRPSYDVWVTPQVARRHPEVLPALERLLHLPADAVARLTRLVEAGAAADLLVRRDIGRDQLAAIETRSIELPGVYVQVGAHRHYPFDALGAHQFGFMNEISGSELESLGAYGYRPGDYIGRTGLERAFESLLRGAPGVERQVIDVHGRVQSDEDATSLLGAYRRVDPVPGKDLMLTVDMELMAIVEEAASSAVSGGIAVVDPRDGSILSIFSKPGFNPNAWSGRLSEHEKRLSDNNPFHPMIDKSVQSWFPGSTYKVITALAALEEGLITHEDEIHCPGYYEYGNRVFRCWNRHGHGDIALNQALAQSCDVYFYQLGEQLGIDTLAAYASEFGFGERPGIGFNGESPGVVPTREWHEEHSPGGFQYGFTINTSVGQGDTRASPLQLALAYAALWNGGRLYYPRIVDRVATANGRVIFEYPPRVRRVLPFAERHIDYTLAGLDAVVNHEEGTAYDYRLPYVRVAGKTGTAQVRALETVRLEGDEIYFRDRDHAWFVAIAPIEDPRIVVTVFLEHGGQGSSAAAPVAMRIIDRYFREVLGLDDEIDAALATGDFSRVQSLLATTPAPGERRGDSVDADELAARVAAWGDARGLTVGEGYR